MINCSLDQEATPSEKSSKKYMEKSEDNVDETALHAFSEAKETSVKMIDVKPLNQALCKECSEGNFDAVWMLVFAGATNIRHGIQISIKHEHYRVTALLLICHATLTENIQMLENLLKGNADYECLIEFLPAKFTIFDKVRTCLENKEDYTKAAIQVAGRSKPTPTEIVRCLLMNTHCQEKYGKVDWRKLHLKNIHKSWLKSIKAWVQDLNLSDNKISTLPLSVSKLKLLTRLNLSGNNLKVINGDIFHLPCVRYLNISKNDLLELPEFPEWKLALRSLNVSNNQLNELPQSIAQSSLEILNLSNNCFTEVPPCVCKITTLQDLDLSFNRRISFLPDEMGKLRNLCHLGLKRLDKVTYPPEELRQNAQDVVYALRKRLRSCQPYYTMKLMLVGKANQGKTTLVHRLQDDFSYNDDYLTQGVEITDLVIKKNAFNKKFTFKVWDFGGQEDYYATHQCFLSSMSLYLLVWRLIDGEEGVNGLTPWLDNIAVRSPGSTVIVVGTFLDCISPEKYGDQYVPNMKNLVHQLVRKPRYRDKIIVPPQGICAVSCLSGSAKSRNDINNLRRVIYDTAENLKKGRVPVMGEPIPLSFFSLIDRIEKRRVEMRSKKQPPIIRKEEFHAMVKENSLLCKNDIEDLHDVRDATVFLRERGIVMHFDDPNEGLHDLYFIDPRWLGILMARVVTVKCPADLVKEGILKVQKMSVLFKGGGLPVKFLPQYIRLLIRFQVAYLLDRSRILVPSKLPETKPKDLENLMLPFAPVRRVYKIEYERIHGFWPRFVSRFLFHLKEIISADPTRYQKSGDKENKFVAKLCRSCVHAEGVSGTFPCFLERIGSKRMMRARKMAKRSRLSSAKCSRSRCTQSVPSRNSYPMKIFSEEELRKDVDDDAVGIIINEVNTGLRTNTDAWNDSPSPFHNSIVVHREKGNVKRVVAARDSSYISSDDGESSTSEANMSGSDDFSERENRLDMLQTNCSKCPEGFSKKTPRAWNQEREHGADDRRYPINCGYNLTKTKNYEARNEVVWSNNENRLFSSQVPAALSEKPLCNSSGEKPPEFDQQPELNRGKDIRGSKRVEFVNSSVWAVNDIKSEDNTSIASFESSESGHSAGKSSSCRQGNHSSVSSSTSSECSPSSKSPENIFLDNESFLKSNNRNRVHLSERFLDTSNKASRYSSECVDLEEDLCSHDSKDSQHERSVTTTESETSGYTTESDTEAFSQTFCRKFDNFASRDTAVEMCECTIHCKGQSAQKIPNFTKSSTSEIPLFPFNEHFESLEGDGDTAAGSLNEMLEDSRNNNISGLKRLEISSASSISLKSCLVPYQVEVGTSSSSRNNSFISNVPQVANPAKDVPTVNDPTVETAESVGIQGATCADSIKTPSFHATLSTNHDNSTNNQPHLKGSSHCAWPKYVDNVDCCKARGVHGEKCPIENSSLETSGQLSYVKTGKCTLCEDNVPLNQLVTIPLDVTELIEKDFLQCWQSGICLNHPSVFLAVSERSVSDALIIESAVSPSPLGRRLLTAVVDHLDRLIEEWYPGLLISFGAEPTVQKLIPCRLCEENRVTKPHLFPFDLCVTQYSRGNFVKCPQHEVRIQDIAPDLVLHDLDSRLLLDEEEIRYDKTDANRLGNGAFGAVYRGVCRGKRAAIKEYSSGECAEDAMKQYCEVRKEVSVLRNIEQHPFLVNLIGVCLRPFRLVLELAEKGSLANTLTNPDFFIDRIVIYRMIYQVAEALSFLHSLNVIYRDLKPENVLVMSYEEQDDVNVKLTDFGTAMFQFSEGLFSVEGSPGNHAPEMLEEFTKRTGYNEKVDVFSLGMLIYRFITRRHPFNNANSGAEINSKIIQGEKPVYDDVLVSRIGLVTLTWLMERCLRFSPHLRPTSRLVAKQVRSPTFQILLGTTTLTSYQTVRHVCVVEATRELWVAVEDNTETVVLVYELKKMAIIEKFTVDPMHPLKSPSCLRVSCMHATTKSVLIGLGGDHDVVAIHDIRTYGLKAKIPLQEPVISLSSNHRYIFLGMSSGLLRVVPTLEDKNPETVEVCSDPITSMVAVDNYLWLASKRCVYIYNTEPGENTRAFEMHAIRYSLPPSPVTILVMSKDKRSIWCACLGSSIVSGWDVTGRRELSKIDCEPAVRRVSSVDKPLSPNERCVTSVVAALDTVWVGTGGGMLLIFHASSGELITWMNLFDDRVRTLTLVSEPGPYSSDRCYVIASGENLLKAALSCDGEVVCPLVPEVTIKPRSRTLPIGRNNTLDKLRRRFSRHKPRALDNSEFNSVSSTDDSSLLLLEVLPAELLRRIEAKSPR